MGLWSSIKKKAKKAWRAVKAAVRVIAKSVLTGLMIIIKFPDLLFGFIGWPPKKMRLHVVILPKYPESEPAERKAKASFEAEVRRNIAQIERIWRERMNVHLQPYGPDYIEYFEGHVPDRALNQAVAASIILARNSSRRENFMPSIPPAGLEFPSA